MSDIKIEGISRKWEIVLAFFLGGAVSSLAQDPSDTLFFFASQQGWLSSAKNQTLFWYWIPFLLYIGLFLLGYLLARTGKVSPSFLLYFYAFLEVISAFFSFSLSFMIAISLGSYAVVLGNCTTSYCQSLTNQNLAVWGTSPLVENWGDGTTKSIPNCWSYCNNLIICSAFMPLHTLREIQTRLTK